MYFVQKTVIDGSDKKACTIIHQQCDSCHCYQPFW